MTVRRVEMTEVTMMKKAETRRKRKRKRRNPKIPNPPSLNVSPLLPLS